MLLQKVIFCFRIWNSKIWNLNVSYFSSVAERAFQQQELQSQLLPLPLLLEL
jgi:hypothetical protein